MTAYRHILVDDPKPPVRRITLNPRLSRWARRRRGLARGWGSPSRWQTVRGSNEWVLANRKTIFGPNVEAVRRAYRDAGREIPADYRQRTSGARDVDDDAPAGYDTAT